MRLWHQIMTPLRDLGGYADAVSHHLQHLLPSDVEVDLHGSAPGTYLGFAAAEVLRFPIIKHLVHQQIFDQCMTAERSGYDGIVLATFAEPFLPEIRSLVDIPVTSMPESCLFLARSYARKFGLVTLTPSSIPRVQALVNQHGFRQFVTVVALDPPITEIDLISVIDGASPDRIVDSFVDAGRRAMVAGADLTIPAEGILNEVLWSSGIHDIDGSPVCDVLAMVMSYAQLMVTLGRTNAVSIARRFSYPRPPADLIDRAITMSRSTWMTGSSEPS